MDDRVQEGEFISDGFDELHRYNCSFICFLVIYIIFVTFELFHHFVQSKV